MHSFGYGLWYSEHAIRPLPWPVLEEHDDIGFMQEQSSYEVVAHSPKHGELIDRIMPLKRRFLDRHDPLRMCHGVCCRACASPGTVNLDGTRASAIYEALASLTCSSISV